MALGSAAGVAAKQLVDGHAPTVQDVDVSTVQGILVPPPTACGVCDYKLSFVTMHGFELSYVHSLPYSLMIIEC